MTDKIKAKRKPNKPKQILVRTEKRLVILPVVCWVEVDKMKDGYSINSHGEALLSIMTKVYPQLLSTIQLEARLNMQKANPTDKKETQSISKGVPETNQMDVLNTPSQFDVCYCVHPRNTHDTGKCIVKGCPCKKFDLDIVTTTKERIKHTEENS